MEKNKIHLYFVTYIFRVLQFFGILQWKVTPSFTSNLNQKVTFSRFAFIFSVCTVLVVIYATIKQSSRNISGFDTTYNTNLSGYLLFILRMTQFISILVTFIPIWILRKQMKHMHEKLIMVKVVLRDVNKEMSESFISVGVTIKIVLWISFVVVKSIIEFFVGSSIARNNHSIHKTKAHGMDLIMFLTFVFPFMLRNLVLLHFIINICMMKARIDQVQMILDKIQ